VPRIARTMGLACGLLGGLITSQAPEYAQQYRQRLGGAADELRRVVQRFDHDAQATGQTREGAIGRLNEHRDELIRRQGDAMRANVERLDRLERQRQAFQTAGPFQRLAVMARDFDPDIARAAYQDFEPAVPTTTEGFVTAGAGFLAGWGLSRLIGIPLGYLFFRRRRPLVA
jgi:hypothetical protein